MKDIFIDNNVAKNFANPLDPEYKKLIVWLQTYSESNKANNAYLVVSRKIIAEYIRTCGANLATNNIVAIIGLCQKQGRLNNVSNEQIRDFRAKYFTKKNCRRLRSNWQDHDHIPVVLMSHRKFALSIDEGFVHDLLKFPGFKVVVAKRPQDLKYE